MTDDTGTTTKAELEQRVERLESLVQKLMPTRRQALGLGAAALGGAALSNPAAALGESESYGAATGTVGSDSAPLTESNVQDFHAQTLVVDTNAQVEDLDLVAAASRTVSFSSGGSKAAGLTLNGVSPGQPIVATAAPANAPANDHGYTVDRVWYDSSGGVIRAAISETENDGGGDAQLAAWTVGAL